MPTTKTKHGTVADLAPAIDLIERNCGPDTRQHLSGHPKLTPKAIGCLSRTSPERQQRVLDFIRAGHAKPLMITAVCALDYDTVGFHEVLNRLNLARGATRREVEFISAKKTSKLDRGPDRLLTISMIIETVKDIAGHVRTLRTEGVGQPWNIDESGGDQTREISNRLSAAAALGRLAKLNRNLPILKPEHHPTSMEQRQALALCQDIVSFAQPVLLSARQRCGRLDQQLWLRSPGSTRRIITHANPDGDAIVSAWLAERFLFAGEPVDILFVPRERVLGCFRAGDCLVDVGNSFDPARHVFDHKPPALPSRHDSCAAKLVWEHLRQLGKPVQHLEHLVLAVFAWDSVKRRREFEELAIASKQHGFHAALDGAKKKGLNNVNLYRHLRRWLDHGKRHL